jgi:hypothetical protein
MSPTVLVILGTVVVLVGLYLCITGAPPITATDLWGALSQMPPRFIAGVILIIIGAGMVGNNLDKVLGSATGTGGGGGSSPAPSVIQSAGPS